MVSSAKEKSENNYYESINGLRAFSAIGIIMMHVRANSNYQVSGIIYDEMIGKFGYLAFFFMMISAFSMCCGYYNKILKNEISIVNFYNKRYTKIWPYFALLVVLDIMASPSINSIYEGIANLTLCFALLPNPAISVIGVGWTLGLIFVFYMIFPFFCYLMSSKRKAWFVFIVSLILNYSCEMYFFDKSHVLENYNIDVNIIYCAAFFVAGGLIYLYRESLIKLISHFRIQIGIIMLIATPLLFVYYSKYIVVRILIFAMWLAYAISVDGKILNNKFTRFVSNISMEIYLCHMLIIRLVEKTHILFFIENEIVAYVIETTVVIVGAIMFAIIMNKIVNRLFVLWKMRGKK